VLHAVDEDDPDRLIEFCEWFLHTCDERESFPDFTVWSDKATYKLSTTVNGNSCVYWATENLHVTEEQAVHVPGVLV
jgi:hypothetical protein